MTCTNCGASLEENETRCPACLRQQPANFIAQATQPLPSQPTQPLTREPLVNSIAAAMPRYPVSAAVASRLALYAGLVSILWFVIGFKLDLIVIFPAIAGFIVGAVIDANVKKNKIRNVPLALSIGIAAGLLTYAVKLLCEILYMRSLAIDGFASDMMSDNPGITLAAAKAAGAHVITFSMAFHLWVEIHSTYGISIGHVGTSGAPIKGIGVWIVYAAQAAIIAWIAGAAASQAASAPYCEGCAAWKRSINTMSALPTQTDTVVQHVQAQDWDAVKAMPRKATIDPKNVCLVGVSYCPKCDEGDVVVTKTAGGKSKTVFRSPAPTETICHLRSIEGSM